MENLNEMGLVELKQNDINKINGGFAPVLVWAVIALYAAGTVAAVSQGKNPHTGRNL